MKLTEYSATYSLGIILFQKWHLQWKSKHPCLWHIPWHLTQLLMYVYSSKPSASCSTVNLPHEILGLYIRATASRYRNTFLFLSTHINQIDTENVLTANHSLQDKWINMVLPGVGYSLFISGSITCQYCGLSDKHGQFQSLDLSYHTWRSHGKEWHHLVGSWLRTPPGQVYPGCMTWVEWHLSPQSASM